MDHHVDTKTRIISTAALLFYQHSFESVGLQKICTQAKVSKSSFYHFFNSKDEVAVAVVEAHWKIFEQEFSDLMKSTASPLQKIQSFLENLYTKAESACNEQGMINGCPFGNLASELSNSNPALHDQIQLVFENMSATFANLIEQAKEQGELSTELEASDAADEILVLLQGLSIIGIVYNDPVRIRRTGEKTLRLILGVASTT